MSEPVSDGIRARYESLAAKAVAVVVDRCRRQWGDGWNRITPDHRRGEVSARVLETMIGAIKAENAESAVYCVAIANAVMQTKF